MKIYVSNLMLILTLMSCSNSADMKTGEIKNLQLLKQAFENRSDSKIFIQSRDLLSREQIDAAKTPVLFVELASGQNGTLTPYPGQGIGQTWLGADGATVTLQRGVLKASRGMGDDLMGSSSSMPPWSKINKKTKTYNRELAHLAGNNQIFKRVFSCKIEKTNNAEFIEIWDLDFKVDKFEEHCFNKKLTFKNIYHVDTQGIVRSSSQYHSETVGTVLIERLDR